MRIFYSAGNLIGANLRLSEFIKYSNNVEIKTAAYYKNSDCLDNITFCLDALKNNPTKPNKDIGINLGNINYKNLYLIIDFLIKWNPNLIIVDYEPFLAKVAKELDIPLWSCSPAHMLDGLDWSNTRKYISLKERQSLNDFNHAKRKFIYSPFVILNTFMPKKQGYEFVMPYQAYNAVKNDFVINGYSSNGESNCILNGLKLNKKILIYNSLVDLETKINGFLVEEFRYGKDIGNVSKVNSYVLREIEKFNELSIQYNLKEINLNYLHEELCQI